ncbi:MAG TPA: dienelactone hydrolase family protein [Kofleriaceae bacterium]|nr:dienelactone hydrolase family protein [Kofleriaceae bacterium]
MDDLKRYLVEEAIEDYEQGRISRRAALSQLGGLVGAAVGAQLLAACSRKEKTATTATPASDASTATATGTATPDAAPKPLVAPDDPEILAGATQFSGEGGVTLSGYLARPSQAGSYAIVLVCHENRGLTAHIEDVTRRVAKAGYTGLAVDLVSRDGGTAKHTYDDVPGVLGKAPPERHVQDFLSGLAHARAQPSARGDRVGMTGFCFGGGVTWRMAAALPDLRAAVPFYGMPIDVAEIPKIQAAVLGIYAAEDERINQAVPAVEQAMADAKKTFKKIVYPGTQHAFHNDTRERYNEAAARAAWGETLAWFAQYLA